MIACNPDFYLVSSAVYLYYNIQQFFCFQRFYPDPLLVQIFSDLFFLVLRHS